MENKPGQKFMVLRIKAEETLKERIPDALASLEALPTGEVQRLLHELQVHQVELEMQNEELRRAQLELEVSRAQYFHLYDLAPVGYITLDQWGLIEQTNLTAARLLGLEKEILIGKPLTRFIAREDQDRYYLNRKDFLERGGQKTCEIRMAGKNGTRFWAQMEMAAKSDRDYETPGCRVVIIDVTDRRQAEEMLKAAHLQLEQKVKERTAELEKANEELQIQIGARNKAVQSLRESEQHFRSIVETLPVAIFIQSERGISFANTAAAKLMEVINHRDLLGKSLNDFLDPGEPDKFAQQLKEVLIDRVKKETRTARLVSTMGRSVDVELHLTPSTDQGAPAVQIIAYNLTERKKIEEEMAKADKLDAISILAGGIAHDFNNYLATILGNITLAVMQTDKQGKIYKYLENMERATHRVKLLSNQLFAFAKGGAPLKKTMFLHNIIEESTKFVLTGSNISCRLSLPENLHPAAIDEGQITQVLYNIIINAIQAMPEGGTIQITGENVTIEAASKSGQAPLADGEYVKISIKDEGPGIPEKYLLKIFDPFFTTKREGSGLGLATSFAIIKNHDGYIQAESHAEQGATFSIFLPACRETSLPDTTKAEIIYGAGKILVLDDEAGIREIMGTMLESLGYEVCFAKDGVEALAAYREANNGQEPFDLIVLDLTIPGGMGGKEVIQILRQEDPGVKAVVSSGYSHEPIMANYTEYGFKGAIKKPYTITEVSQVIHEVMNISRKLT